MTDSPEPAQQVEAEQADKGGQPAQVSSAGGPAADAWDKLSVVVMAGDRAVFSIDEDGTIRIPSTFALRSEVGVALARASAVLAAQPEPTSTQQVLALVFQQLGGIDTDAARAAFAGLEAAVNGQTEALASATAVLGDAIQTAPGTH